jgi:hypothetical protein
MQETIHTPITKSVTTLKSTWANIISKYTIWDRLFIQDNAFYFKANPDLSIKLSSFEKSDLEVDLEKLSWLGKFLVKQSPFAHILCAKPGGEEVTFYSLLNQSQGNMVSKKIDRKLLNIGSTPLNWRRDQVTQTIKQNIFNLITLGANNFTLLDIGAGGGFDGLEIQRCLAELQYKSPELPIPEYKIINIDPDEHWQKINRNISGLLFPNKQLTTRHNISIFDYLDNKQYKEELNSTEHLIISCNGFAEFLSDNNLFKLLAGIKELLINTPKSATFVFPFATHNKKQEKTAKLTGFNYKAKKKISLEKIINAYFDPDFKIEAIEAFSQLVFTIHKKNAPYG